MPEAITYYVGHAGNFAEFGESITISGEGILSPSITITKGDAPRALTYLSQAVWKAYYAGAISISPNPEEIGSGGNVNSPLYGNRAASDSITTNYVVTKDDCGRLKELNGNDIVVTLPNASDFISDANGKFYVTFLVRGTGCAFLAGVDSVIENPKLGMTQYCAVTAFLHVKGNGEALDAVWGIYGGVVEAV